MSSYQSKAGDRFALVWQRMPIEDRQVICQLGGIAPGSAAADLGLLSHWQLQKIARGMRAVISLAGECELALSYKRGPRGARIESPASAGPTEV